MNHTFEAADVKARASGQWSSILASLGGIDQQLLDGKHCACPRCGGTDRFRIIDEAVGACYCNQCFNQQNGDGLAALQWLTGKSFPEVVRLVAEYLGMTAGKGDGRPRNGQSIGSKPQSGESLEDSLTLQFIPIRVTEREFQNWLDSKRPITLEAVNAAGCKTVLWPKNAPPGCGHRCLAVPFRGPDGHVSAVQLYRINSEDFPAFKTLAARKIHTLRGSKNGWLCPGGEERIKSATTIWRAEGPSDTLAFYPVLPADYAVVTSSCGAGGIGGLSFEMFRGKAVRVVGDSDQAGQAGAVKFAAKFRAAADDVRVVRLPGKGDVRDFLNAGGTFSDLQRLADAAEQVPEPAAEDAAGSDDDIVTNSVMLPDTDDPPIPVSMDMIVAKIQELTDGWPRRVGSALFTHEPDQSIAWLENVASLFGWIGSKTGRPAKFSRAPDCHSKSEVFAELRRTATSYGGVEEMPHEPPVPGVYYACSFPAVGDGQALRGLVDRFCPETPIDSDLITAMFVTAIWGGTGGSRPAFLITADAGRGAGKTTLPAMIGHLLNGVIELSAQESVEVLKQRLLSPEGLTKRVALLDNVKSLRFSWADLEALITSSAISGKRLYIGESQRPNNLLWCLTLNGASLATDLAQRCVIIKLRKPEHSGNWLEDTRAYIDQHRDEIIGDCIGFLRSERHELQKFSRWSSWESNVLSRLPEPAEAQAVILERQKAANVEVEETEIIEQSFGERLVDLDFDIDVETIFLPSRLVAKWLGEILNDRLSTIGACRMLKQKIDAGELKRLSANLSHSRGRGFLWTGIDCGFNSVVETDLEHRIELRRRLWTE